MASQTVSMTLGIVGCHTNENVQSMAMIMESRGAAIAADMSRGQGENLEAMAAALGVEVENRSEFYRVLSGNFNTIFPNSDTTSGEAVSAIVALLEKNESLSKYVTA